MRLHKLTLSFLIITIILVLLNSYKILDYAPWNRSYYLADLSVAENHPIDGSFKLITKRGAEFEIPKEDNYGGWGYGFGSEIAYMQLPRKLSAHWVALRERKIYKGTFELPYEKIDSIFKMDNPNIGKFEPYYNDKTYNSYTFDIGIEPDGYITLWLRGNYKYHKEIARFKAETTDKYLENATEQESIDILTERFFERSQYAELDSIFKHKLPADNVKWKKYSKKYNYYLQFKDFPKDVKSIYLSFFNQEIDEYFILNNKKHLIKSGVPFLIKSDNNDNDKDIRLRLSEELIDIFRKKQLELKTNDTLVFSMKYDGLQKSIEHSLTTVNEFNR